jgi:hypothetical protein
MSSSEGEQDIVGDQANEVENVPPEVQEIPQTQASEEESILDDISVVTVLLSFAVGMAAFFIYVFLR